jgi:deoxyribodipyrimidine photo-lyase
VSTVIVWLRRDLRLADNPALARAVASGRRVLPVYIHAPEEEGEWAPGAASRAWLHRSLASLDASLRALGSRLVLRVGPSLAALEALVAETGAEAVYWNRRYEPASLARDAAVKQALRVHGIEARSHNAALLVEPWEVQTGQGDPYRVFTPFWRAASRQLERYVTEPPPRALHDPGVESLPLESLALVPRSRWDHGFWERWQPGERGARDRLEQFLDAALDGYAERRDRPDLPGTSRLSPHLHFGEIGPRQVLAAVQERLDAVLPAKASKFIAELGWREFSHHLLYHFPDSASNNLNRRFDAFAWREPEGALLEAWRHGRTGIPIVDAGMRELWATGWMHNRVRMIVASLLTKNLRVHWLHGARWFWDTLVDADLANNTQGWQWTAGTGADAAPYFRIFNPVAQGLRFDPEGTYVRRWVPELAGIDAARVHAPWEQGGVTGYPAPIVDLRSSREDALAALKRISGSASSRSA